MSRRLSPKSNSLRLERVLLVYPMIPVVRSAGSREKDWLYKHGNFLPSTRCEMSPASGENVCHGATMKRYRSSNPFDRLCWRSLTPDTFLQKHRSIVHAIGRTPVVKQHRENRAERESCPTPRISHKRKYVTEGFRAGRHPLGTPGPNWSLAVEIHLQSATRDVN